jgi:colicin import membrane protein
MLALDPVNEDAPGLIAQAREEAAAATEVEAEEARRAQIDILLTEARRQLRGEDHVGAMATAQRVFELEPDHRDARRLIARAREEQETAQRQAAEQERRALDRQVDGFIADARGALRRDLFEEAVTAAEAALAVDPDNEDATELLARARSEGAVQAEAEAEEARQAQIEMLLTEARLQLREEDHAGAMATAQGVFAIEPDHREARRLVAQAREEQEEAQRRAVEQEARERREQIDGFISEARRALRRDNFEEAAAAAEAALAVDPDDEEATELLARARTEAAAQAEAEATRALGEQIDSLVGTARRSLRADDHDAAIAAAEQVLDLDAGNEDAAEIIAQAQAGQAEALLRAQEQEIETLLETARSLRRTQQFDEARANAQRVLALDAGNRAAADLLTQIEEDVAEAASADREQQVRDLVDRAEAERAAGDLEGALATLRSAAELEPDNRRVRRRIRRAESEVAEAVAAEERAAQRARADEIETLLGTARAQLRAGDFAGARSTIQQVFDLDAGSREAGDLVAAIEEAESEAAQDAREQQVRGLLEQAETQRDSGDLEAAAATLRQAAALDPDNRRVQRNLRRVGEEIAEAAEEAQERAREAREEALEVAEDATRRGERAMGRERFAVAVEHYQAALAAVPDHAPAVAGFAAAEQALAGQLEAERAVEATSAREAISRQMYEEAMELYDDGLVEQAQQRLRESLTTWPDNERARRALAQLDEEVMEWEQTDTRRRAVEVRALTQGLIEEGRQAYNEGDVIGAVERWRRVVELDPDNQYALTYLEETGAEYEGALAMRQTEADRLSREDALRERLGTPIAITTPPDGTPLQVFLNNISVFTELDFLIADGVDVTVTGSFIEKPLREVLDAVITSNGLTWTVEETIITIRPRFLHRLYQLNPDDAAALAVFKNSGFLDRLLYPPDGVRRVEGQSYELDEITGTFIVTGSESQIQRIEDLVSSLPSVTPTVMVTRIYTVREDEGERLRKLVESVLDTERTPQTMAFDRTIFLQEDNLVVRAPEREHARIEELLREYGDEGSTLSDRGLEVATYSLIPRRVLQQNEEVARDLAGQIKETVEVLLYSQTGADAARRQGRRLWFDEFTLQLTITDSPDNISRITQYIQAIPQLEQQRITKIVNLDHQLASTLAGKLEDFLGIEIRGVERADGGQAAGNVVVRTLRVEDEFTFRDLRITLLEVEENDIADDLDEDVTLIIDTLTTSEERTIEELRSEIIDEYRIRVVDADAGSSPNSGRAELEITFLGGAVAGRGQVFQAIPAGAGIDQQVEGAQEAEPTVEDERIPIVQPDDDTNSLLISVVEAGDLELIEQAVELLDIPILQASIDTQFVEVNESRAREVQSELSILNLQDGVSFSDAFMTGRFGRDADEFRSVFESFPEGPLNASLPKGRTVLSLITGGSSPLQWELSFLEAEGVVSTVNGPHIVAQNNQGADFEITMEFQAFDQIVRVIGQTLPNTITNQPPDVFGLDPVELVELDVTPTITQSGYITLDIDIEIANFTNQLGQLVSATSGVFPLFPGLAESAESESAIMTLPGMFSNNRKELATTVRVRDGGTVVLGGWTLERVTQTSSGVPLLRNLPYVGQAFFSRNQDFLDRLTLMVFLTAQIVDVE